MSSLLRYEVKNTLGNIFSIIFGVIFPILMTYIIYYAAGSQIPAEQLETFSIQLFSTNLLISPLALVFIGFSALFSQEVEKDITLRMVLFGQSEKKQLLTKFAAQMLALLFSTTLYIVATIPLLKLPVPSFLSILLIIGGVFLFSIMLFVIAYSITLLARKFSITYGITMSLYFLIMILSGMMGIRAEQLPSAISQVANLIPTTQLISVIPKIWVNASFNLMPLLQSFLFLGAISGILYLIAIKKNERTLK